MAKLKFVTDLPATRNKCRSYQKTRDLMQQLAEQPGTWALLATYKKATTASVRQNYLTSGRAAGAPKGALQAAVRTVGTEARLYVRITPLGVAVLNEGTEVIVNGDVHETMVNTQAQAGGRKSRRW